MAKLRTYVHVKDEQGQDHAFGPDDVVPEWAQVLITNPKAWLEPPSASRLTEPAPVSAVKKAPAKRAAPRRKVGGSAVSDG
ncbi:hypothetical protein [Streptomyces sp. NPDC057509]|uniref:hypothetical protein n=1 Tax=Streptomyces sp. NPDC057509 TaxID=3346152 RepID=UPI0036A7B653